MRLAPVLAALLVLPGCAGPRMAPEHFLVDGPDANVDGFADLLWADIQELNGSLVLVMEFEDMQGRIPEFTATFELQTDVRGTWFLRSQPNLSKPAPHVEYVVGRVEDNQYNVVEPVCAMTEITRSPWLIRVEAEHRITGLSERAGTLRGLSIQTSDFENHPMDTAETSATFDLRGGANPHNQCPLHAERS